MGSSSRQDNDSCLDTSPLNYLILIGEIDILPQLYGQLLLPPAVHRELQQPGTPSIVVAWAQNLPSWAHVKAPHRVLTATQLDRGEREAIALALEENAPLIILDEQRGRRYAQQQGLTVTGTLGVFGGRRSTRLDRFARYY